MFHVFRDDAHRRLTVTLNGAVSFAELARFLNTQRAQGAWDYGVLYDAREVTTLLPDEDLEALADHLASLNQRQARGAVAVVGTLDGLETFVERYAALVKPVGIQIALFADVATADHWLRSVDLDARTSS